MSGLGVKKGRAGAGEPSPSVSNDPASGTEIHEPIGTASRPHPIGTGRFFSAVPGCPRQCVGFAVWLKSNALAPGQPVLLG
jgi:hypothetical protein